MSAARGAAAAPRVGYLVTRYPAVSHSFVQREVMALRDLGAEVETFSVHPPLPADLFTAEDRAEAQRTFSIRSRSMPRIAACHLGALLRHPRAYLATLRFSAKQAAGGGGRLLAPLFHFAEAVVLWRETQRRGIRHLHAHFTSPSADVAHLASRLAERASPGSLSWSFTAHGTDILGDHPGRLAEKVRNASPVICVSAFGRAQLMRLVAEEHWQKIRVVRCGLDARWQAAAEHPQRRAAGGERLRLLTVGRLEREKGHALLLEALAELRDGGTPFELTIVGDGSARQRLSAQAQGLGLEDWVTFAGKAGQDTIQEYYAAADLFCLPSLGEGVPVVLMEAMAMGVPVVATRVGGVAELVEDGVSGRVVAPGSAGELAAALAELAGDPERRALMAAAARQRVVEGFGIERAARLLFDEFLKVAPRAAETAATPSRAAVCMVPADVGNPYQRLLGGALAKRGADVRLANRLRLSDLSAAPGRSVIHLHWIEFIVRSTSPGLRATVVSLARTLHLLAILSLARLRGIRIVWTVHNLRPHEGRRPWLDRLANRAVARLANLVLAHSHHCARLIAEQAGPRNIEVGHHGNYVGYYPPARRSRAQARAALRLPADSYVLLAFGQVRPYKQLPALIEAFRAVEDPRLRLLVAGRPLDDVIRRQVEEAAAGDPRILLRLESIPEEEVVELHQLADLAVLAYEDVFSSGALMLALSCGLPVLAPAGGTAEEIGEAPAVRCYREGTLAAALASDDLTKTAVDRGQATALAERFGWDPPARKVLGG